MCNIADLVVEQSMKKGMEQGMEKGIEQGKKLGEELGRKLGERNKEIQIVSNMFHSGLSFDLVRSCTSILTDEEIHEIEMSSKVMIP